MDNLEKERIANAISVKQGGPSWNEVREILLEDEVPNMLHSRDKSWVSYVPPSVRDVWSDLSCEARFGVYILAQSLANDAL